MKIKKIGRTVWFVLLLLLPTLIAIFSFFMIYNNVYISPKNIYDISLYHSDGTLIASEKNYLRDAENEGLVSLFSPITQELSETTSIPDFIDKSKYFRATVNYMNTQNEYFFYFSVEDIVGYCTLDENSYKLDGSDTEKFLTSTFAEILYERAEPPKMYSISGETILPKSVNWSYETVKDDYNLSEKYELQDDVQTYTMSGALGVYFSEEPDTCTVNVTRNGERLFSGSYRELSSVTFEHGTVLNIEVIANWKYFSDSDHFGSIKYEFDATVSDRAVFHLTGDSFAIDSFCGIICTNVKDASNIVFESEPEFPAVPDFELSQSNAVALLPILPQTPIGEYKFTLSYGAATETFVVNVTQQLGRVTLDCSIQKEILDAAFSEDSMKEVSTLKEYVAEISKGEKLFYGSFLDYTKMGAVQHSYFGDIYLNSNINETTGLYYHYLSDGHEYRFRQTGGVRVSVLNGGRVIKTGYNDYLGNYVIVSHGCGLATWYAHMSTVDVAEGDYVVRGESIGKTGVSGVSNIENVLVLATLGAEFTNPIFLCGEQFD